MSADVAVVVDASADEVQQAMDEQAAQPIVCTQCHYSDHLPTARFCLMCGARISTSDSLIEATINADDLLTPQSSTSSSIHSTSPSVTTLLESLDSHTRARMDYSTRLWDQSSVALEKTRASKHTAKSMAGFYAELGKIEKTYSNALAKLIANPEYGSALETNERSIAGTSSHSQSSHTSTLLRAWSSIKLDISHRSRSHSIYADTIVSRVEGPLNDLRKMLSWKKEKLEEGIQECADQLKKANEFYIKCKQKHDKMQLEVSRGSTKFTQQDVSLAFDTQTQAQLQEYKLQNQMNRVLAENLGNLEEVELERLQVTRRVLLVQCLTRSEMDRKYLAYESELFNTIQQIDEVAEVTSFVELHHSKLACPWASVKTALTHERQPSSSPQPASSSSAHVMSSNGSVTPGRRDSFNVNNSPPTSSPSTTSDRGNPFGNPFATTTTAAAAVPPPHSKVPRAAKIAGLTAAGKAATMKGTSSSAAGGTTTPPHKAGSSSKPNSRTSSIIMRTGSPSLSELTGGATGAPRTQRNIRGNNSVLSPEAVALVSNTSPIIAELAIPPPSAQTALPSHLSPHDLPFPTIGLPKRVEPLPERTWSPVIRDLFPDEHDSALPDVSCLELIPQEYNRMCYEQLLLSTNLLLDIQKQEHFDTILRVVRVQLNIPQAEHDLLVSVLTIEQGWLANSPSTGLLTEQEQKSTKLRQRMSASNTPASSVASTPNPSMLSVPQESPVLHVSDSMLYVQYRLLLLKSVRSSRFPSLTLYQNWFKRQIHVVWLAVMWTCQMQVNAQAANGGKPENVSPVKSSSKKGGGEKASSPSSSASSSGSSLTLTRFKQTLQLIQLLSFSLTSKIDTKLFVYGDSVLGLESGQSHTDILELFSQLENTLQLFPPPYKSVLANSLSYPSLLLNKVYMHLIHISCISGGDELGRPIVRERHNQRKHGHGNDESDRSGDDTDASDTDDDEDEGLSIHPSYLTVIASLSAVRTQWKVSEFYHQYSLLHLCMHIVYYQSLDYDGKLLDTDAMIEVSGEKTLLPLFQYVTNAICGTLRSDIAALLNARPDIITPESLDYDENTFLCFTLRNIGYALSDYQKFTSPPVRVCLHFYYSICGWLGVRDTDERIYAFLKIATTNFYQTLIPTEQQLLLSSPLGDGGGGSISLSQPKRGSLGVKPTSPMPKTPTKHQHQPSPSGDITIDLDYPSRPTTPKMTLNQFSTGTGPQIQITPKKMSTWTSDEWKTYTKHMCTFIRDQIEDFYPEFLKEKSLAGVLSGGKPGGRRKKKATVVKDGDESVPSSPPSSSSSLSLLRPNAAEICILQILRCFAQDVTSLLADRSRTSAGMDETLISLVSSLVRLQSVLMDSDYSAFWSSDSIKTEISHIFPNIQDLCTQAMRRWIEIQTIKVEGIRERCVTMDEWKPEDDINGTVQYSHSVKDLFNFLHTLLDGFWSHSRSMQGYGVSDTLPQLIELYNKTLIQYGAQVVESAGLDVLPQLFPTKDIKLKQVKQAPDSKDKAKAFMKGIFKNKEKESAHEHKDEEEDDLLEWMRPLLHVPQKGIVTQTTQSLCVRLCCIEVAIENSIELSTALKTTAEAFCKEFVMIAPLPEVKMKKKGKPGKDPFDDDDDDEDEDEDDEDEKKASSPSAESKEDKRWALWQDFFTPPTRMKPFSSAASSSSASSSASDTNVFHRASESMHAYIETLADALGVMKVYADWRSGWISKLYMPTPSETNRIIGGEIEVRIEENMPIIHVNVTRTLFPIVARQIFIQLLSAVQYIILYGRRSIQEDQVRTIIRSDVEGLIGIFKNLVDKDDMKHATKELLHLLDVMELGTKELCTMYQQAQKTPPVPFPILARIICARNGSDAKKLIDKIRGK